MMKQSSPAGNIPKLAQPAVRALNDAGIHTLEALGKMTEKELAALHGIGPDALKRLKKAMQEKGLSFKKGL
ncbi:helix-hairpin-helix domain-containing protein [uncultured Chitinophaga sp.]|uniref:helix-hairpin-helix domain-containing protein n=1 Tax=uncultured Chitinophaga sp. TaxID=339340 RepID=UPI0025E2520D|nr:helix-hairpin-helix domain-containing protein [uncultured Chitinophaga sp.]